MGTFVNNLKLNDMIFKFLITLLYAGFTAIVFYKFFKRGAHIKGNETIMLMLPVLTALLPGGEASVCFARVSFGLTPLLAYIFLEVLNKDINLKKFLPFYISLALIPLFEIVAHILEFASTSKYLVYSGFYLLMVILFDIWLIKYRFTDKDVNNMLSMGRLYNLFITVLTAVLVQGGGLVLVKCIDCRAIPQVATLIILGLNIFYVVKSAPRCLQKRDSQYMKIRKRAYILGESTAKGDITDDSGFGIINDSVIDDARIISSLIELFERDKIYRNTDVKIINIAIMLGTNKTYLSRALNTRVGKNFCQFVNFYRVREICQLYIEDTTRDIKDLSERCGFSSPSNFSIVFKYSTGFTPGDWCKVVKSKLEANEQVSVDDFVM